jgi:hypothetical protein
MPSLWEVEDLYRRSIQELGLPCPAPEEYLRQHAHDVAEGLVSGTVEPLEGARLLNSVAETLGYPKDMASWGKFDEDLFLEVDADGEPLYYSESDMISYIEREAQTLLQKIPKKYF